MVQMVTPAPTPSADEFHHLSTPAISNAGSPWLGSSLRNPSDGQWHYGTPPLENAVLSQSSYNSTPNGQLTSSWHDSPSMKLRSRSSSYRRGHIAPRKDDDEDFFPQAPSTKATRRMQIKEKRRDKSIKFPDLEVPLSIWASNNHIEPTDVAEFATRDIESRIARAVKDGYVKRNLNIFFLYKRAYSKVAQAWMARHHPALAKTQPPLVTLVGESWKKESQAFKSSYNKYSEQERDGLKKAFPDYKYKPGAKKTQATEDPSANHQSNPEQHRRGQLVDPGEDWLHRVYSNGSGTFGEPIALPYGEQLYHASAYGIPSMPTVHEAGPMITDQATAFLQPGRPRWGSYMNDRSARSVSPAPSQLSYQTSDHIPIDPGLPDGFSDYVASREASEEPALIAPSQLTYSRMPSDETAFGNPCGLNNAVDWVSDPAMSRCASEEPWQSIPDAYLSSLPTSDIAEPAPNEDGWHLETLGKNEPLQGFMWDARNWDDEFDSEWAHM